MLQVQCVPRKQTFHITGYRQCAAFHFKPYVVPVMQKNTERCTVSLECVHKCFATNSPERDLPKMTAVLVLFPSLLLRSWFCWWVVHFLTLFTLGEVLRDHKLYSKLKKSQRWALLKHGEGSLDDQWCCRVGTIALEIRFHGKSVFVLLLLSVKLCHCFPESQADLSECATSEIIIYTENSVSSSLYFFVGPALDNACWVDPLRDSLQRKGQYLVSSIIYDKNAGKHRQKGWFKNILKIKMTKRIKFEQYLTCEKLKLLTCTENWILHSSL